MSDRTITPGQMAEIEAAYRALEERVAYRPAAPSDGITGAIPMPPEELDIEAEIRSYAGAWIDAEADGFYCGYADFRFLQTMVYAIEAARLCCVGEWGGTAKRIAELGRMITEAAEATR
jgi:hypothetical protein